MPDSAPFSIRRLSAADAEAFRAIRLEGLERHPSAFGASLDEESRQPLSFFAERLEANHVLGAESSDGLSGVAGFRLHDSEKTRHRGTLWGMYVRKEARGTGVARRLVDGILAHARTRVEQVALSVWAENAAAIALYRSAGFVVLALDARSLKIDGAYYDELLMQIRFAEGTHALSAYSSSTT
jgi:ribosomal protein S18 acetylase RimI-like enzyme